MQSNTLLALTATALFLVGCGGSDEPDYCERYGDGDTSLGTGLKCLEDALDGKPGAPVTVGKPDAAVTEYEPNSSLGNANLLDAGGTLSIIGAVGGEDPSDSFVFSPAASGSYSIYLCADTCNEILESDNYSLMVLDQTQTTIAATPIAEFTTQAISVPVDVGLAYYVRITGITGGSYALAIMPDHAQ